MLVPSSLRSLLLLAWLTASVAAQDPSPTAKTLTIPGLPPTAPPPAVIDTVNLFRNHENLRSKVDKDLAKLAEEQQVDLWLVTTSFQTRQSPAQEAAEIVAAWSNDRPAIVLIHIRGNHGTGVAANNRLQEIVPSFELAAALPASADGRLPDLTESAPNTETRVTSLVDTTHKITDLVRRYSGESQAQADRQGNSSNDTPTATSSRRAESLLFITVMMIAALIVWFTARTTRR